MTPFMEYLYTAPLDELLKLYTAALLTILALALTAFFTLEKWDENNGPF